MSFIRLENEDITITAETIISPAWGENTPTLTTFFTSSFQTGSESGPYFWDIYSVNQGTLAPSGSVQFSIAHAVSGSSFTTASHAVWNQYATLLYGSNRTAATASLTNEFFVINVARSKYKENLNVSSFNVEVDTQTFEPTDPTSFDQVDGGRRYALSNGIIPEAGHIFPDVGIITIKSGSLDGVTNLTQFFNQIRDGSANFTLFSEETITSNFVFARTRNSELNYSTNPSFVDNNGNILKPQLVDSPQVFPTTVGLYNDSNELVAVAKLSRPLIKDFNKEALLRIKLDF
jgi:hypothetical protein